MKRVVFIVFCICFLSVSGYSETKDAAAAARDANNPLASIKAASIHNVYSPSIYGINGTSNTTWLRYAQPVWRFLIRASLPINSINVGNIDKSGLGDLNVFATFIITKPTAKYQFGAGPIFTFPTATSRSLGTEKWQAGLAFVAYTEVSRVFQCGLLATWQHSFAGTQNRPRTHNASIQPFLLWQLGKGLYLRSTATKVMDFEGGNYMFPLGLGLGKVYNLKNFVFNIFAEPQITVWHKGHNIPKWQMYVGFNTQF